MTDWQGRVHDFVSKLPGDEFFAPNELTDALLKTDGNVAQAARLLACRPTHIEFELVRLPALRNWLACVRELAKRKRSRAQAAIERQLQEGIEYQGTKLTVAQLAAMAALPEGTVKTRLRRGWAVQQILRKPKGAREQKPKGPMQYRSTYTAWRSMLDHYGNPARRRDFVCDEFKTFESFLTIVGEKPNSWYRLKQLDETKPFQVGNVEWQLLDSAREQRAIFASHAQDAEDEPGISPRARARA